MSLKEWVNREILTHTDLNANFTLLAEEDNDINDKIEMLLYGGMFSPKAGTETYAYDASDRVSTITYATSPVGVVTVVYDDDNNGRVDYIEGVFTDPVTTTIRLTYAYDADDNVTGVTRTVT